MAEDDTKTLHKAFDSFHDQCHKIFMQCEDFPSLAKAMHEWNLHLIAKAPAEHRWFFDTVAYLLFDAYFYAHAQKHDAPFFSFRKFLLERLREDLDKVKAKVSQIPDAEESRHE